MRKIGVLISGRGSNLRALTDAQARRELAGVELCVVFSNVEAAPTGLRAGRHLI